MIRFLSFLLLFPLLLFGEQKAVFTPPSGWELTSPKTLSNRVEIGFINREKSGFCPSLTLTREKLTVTPKQYLSIIQKNSERKRRKWKRLGPYTVRGGKGEMIELEVPTKFGPARLLQLIVFSEGEAFILTGGALKKEFKRHAPAFEVAFRSITVTHDLLSLLTDEKLREKLTETWNKRESDIELGHLNEMVLNECAHMGTVWQILMLKQ